MSSHEHPNPNPYDDPSPAPVATVAIVGVLIVVVLVLALVSLYHSVENRFVEQRIYAEPALYARTLFDQQQAALIGPPTWVDRERGVARIPIDRAIQWVARNPNAPPPASAPGADQTVAGAP